MTVYQGCFIPDDRLYDIDGDLWVRPEGDFVRLGMTDVAQTRMGKLVSIHIKRPGRRVRAGGSVATVESSKWVGPIHTPFAGELVTSNEQAFDDDILVANRDPYEIGWICVMKPDDINDTDRSLVEGEAAVAAYQRRIDELEVRCFRCAD